MRSNEYDGRPQRRWMPVLAGGLCLAVLGGGAYLLGAQGSGSAGASSPPPTTTAASDEGVGSAISTAQPSNDPVTSATAWLQAYRSVSYLDPGPTAWIDRVLPVLTDRLARQYETYRDGSAGADWAEFVAQRCTSRVEQVGGVVPDEAPRTDDTVNVQVSGLVQTRCEAPDAPPRGPENVAATLKLIKGDDGAWHVDVRMY